MAGVHEHGICPSPRKDALSQHCLSHQLQAEGARLWKCTLHDLCMHACMLIPPWHPPRQAGIRICESGHAHMSAPRAGFWSSELSAWDLRGQKFEDCTVELLPAFNFVLQKRPPALPRWCEGRDGRTKLSPSDMGTSGCPMSPAPSCCWKSCFPAFLLALIGLGSIGCSGPEAYLALTIEVHQQVEHTVAQHSPHRACITL